jgi:hypothetical protein
MVTGLAAGMDAGARKSTASAIGRVGETHESDSRRQICPEIALPFATPFTSQETAPSVVPETLAASEMRCDIETVAEGGEMPTLTLLVSVTGAEAVPDPEVAALAAAWIVTGFAGGKSAGAV